MYGMTLIMDEYDKIYLFGGTVQYYNWWYSNSLCNDIDANNLTILSSISNNNNHSTSISTINTYSPNIINTNNDLPSIPIMYSLYFYNYIFNI